jgi:outer membrane biosynthesis protein TonB
MEQSEVSDVTKEGSNEFLFKVGGHKHTFQASSAAERDSWVVALEAKSTEAKAEKETIVSGEGYKAELEKLTKPAVVAAKKTETEEETAPKEDKAEEAKPEEEKKEEKKEDKAAAKSRSQSRKRTSIFGTFLGKKEVEEKKPEETKEETAEETKPAEAVAESSDAAAAPATEETTEGMFLQGHGLEILC